MSNRIAKVNKLLKQVVGKIILEDVDFSPSVVVTIIKAEASADLRYGDIYVSVMPIENAQDVLDELDGNIYAIQQKVNKQLFMKPVPKIRFKLDFGGERTDRINELLGESRED